MLPPLVFASSSSFGFAKNTIENGARCHTGKSPPRRFFPFFLLFFSFVPTSDKVMKSPPYLLLFLSLLLSRAVPSTVVFSSKLCPSTSSIPLSSPSIRTLVPIFVSVYVSLGATLLKIGPNIGEFNSHFNFAVKSGASINRCINFGVFVSKLSFAFLFFAVRM